MPTDHLRLKLLLTHYAENDCTREELLELLTIINEEGMDKDLHEVVTAIGRSVSADDTLPQLDKEKIFSQIIAVKPVIQTSLVRSWIGYAAAILIVGIAVVLYQLHQAPPQMPVKNYVIHTDIAPGGNKAVLTLADGATINLNDNHTGTVATQNQVPVKQVANGAIAYQPHAAITSSAAAYNMLSTPVGGQYSIILADGTKVWLNAMSSLRYPVTFTGSQRKVELTGEGYFEVAPNKSSPFIIAVNNSEVRVYGTHFNIMGYAGEDNTNVTLLEGSVKMTTEGLSKMLVPGQQAIAKNGQIVVRPAREEEALAWKEGKFNFAHEHIDEIMRKLSRWFDIEVRYEGNITTEGFVGTLPRSKNLSEVLNTLALTGSVHFKIEGRRVTVMP